MQFFCECGKAKEGGKASRQESGWAGGHRGKKGEREGEKEKSKEGRGGRKAGRKDGEMQSTSREAAHFYKSRNSRNIYLNLLSESHRITL